MLGAMTNRDFALLILLALFAFVALYFGVRRYRISRIFGREPSDIPALETVRRKLDKINADCRRFAFGAQRIATVSLAGHNVLLIYGLVGFIEALQGGVEKRVYAIAEGDEIEWMRHFPDVFEFADSTASSAVFWVKVPALMRLAKRRAKPPAAPCSSH